MLSVVGNAHKSMLRDVEQNINNLERVRPRKDEVFLGHLYLCWWLRGFLKYHSRKITPSLCIVPKIAN
eukprot:snap_masked-scaffold_6-processed-gene-2.25-mRNA-1 protein AED:1.00 eAED:1.00 QI:0/0/0/0/1/1/2/0/67